MVKPEIEERARKLVARLEDLVPSHFKRFLRKLGKGIEKSVRSNHRRLLVIAGSDPEKVGALAARALLYFERVHYRVAKRRSLQLLYVFHDEFDDAKLRKEIVRQALKSKARYLSQVSARYEDSEKYLGTTFDVLVLDLVNDLKPNDVGRLVGVVRGGGLVVFLTPNWSAWDEAKTVFKMGLTVPGHPEPRHVFIRWFKLKLRVHDGIYAYDADNDEVIKAKDLEAPEAKPKPIEPPENPVFPAKLYKLALTQDQVRVIKAMESFVEKPKRKRVLIVTADRGRGKSCAVGIGLVGLAHELRKYKHRVRILLTAPSLSNVQSLMELALKAAEELGLDPKPVKRGGNVIEIQGKGFSLEYWDPIDVVKLSGDVVAVDEASGIHVPLLHAIWRKHKRLVFAATIHGYEGAGRGFSVRFLSEIKKDPKTELRQIEMKEPIRYAVNDPIEEWLFKTLLLDAEPANLDEADHADISSGNLEYVKLDPEWLFSPEGEETLRQLFGIYVLAHYRNEPDDLGMLADAPHHSIRVLRTRTGGKVVCSVQVAEEGGLDDGLVDELLRGGKIPGNILPDRLLKHLRLREFGKTKGWRIVRIATHPAVQGKGVGSRMLEELYRECVERGYDWLGSGFGVNYELLKFWLKNGFYPLHMSPDRNPVSGEYTVLVLKPVKPELYEVVVRSSREFKLKLLSGLRDTYRDFETDIALLMLKHGPAVIPEYKPELTNIQVDRLWVYAYGPMTYEAACDAVYELAKAFWLQAGSERPELEEAQEYVLVSKVLQAKPWEVVASELGIPPIRVMQMLKEAVRAMIKHYFGLTFESEVGLNLEEAGGAELTWWRRRY